ncbi:MAG: thioredoxin domain-containing protein [Pseudomonadota bacterium]
MDMDQFIETIGKGVTLVDFNASWCAPCKAQEPVIKKLAGMYQNRAAIIEINIDNDGTLATKYGVQSIPTLIIFKDGKEIKRFVGLQSEATITTSLDHAL